VTAARLVAAAAAVVVVRQHTHIPKGTACF